MTHVVHLTSVHRAFDTRIFWRECRTLARDGYSVSLVAPHSTRETVKGIEIVPIPGVNHRLARVARLTRGIWGVYHKARQLQADLYHFHDPELLPVGLLLKLTTPAAVIYDVHENYPENVRAKEWLPSWVRAATSSSVAWLEQVTARRVDGIVTVTGYIARRFPPFKTRVIRNYPSLSELRPLLDQQRSYEGNHTLIYTGGLTDHRGAKQIVQALEHVENPKVKLVLLGGHVHRDTETAIRESPGWSRVDYRGQVPFEAMYRCLQSAAIGLVCNQPVYSYDQALPNKLFEYMSAGLPVIASDFELWKEIIEGNECGVAVDPTSPQEIARAVDYLLEQPELRRRMGRNARRAVQQKYNWEHESPALRQLYREVLNPCQT